MNYYWIPAEQKITQINSATYDMWVATGNPKAQYYIPIDARPGFNYYYDGTQWVQYPPPPPPPPPPLSRLGFLSRFTDQELVAIEVARQTAPTVEMRATLTVLKESWLAANDIDITDSRTQQGVAILVQLGLLTEARMTEILS